MNLLTITDIKLGGLPYNKLSDLTDYLGKRLKAAGIMCQMKVNKDSIHILTNEEKKLFWSEKVNILKLKPDDPRIKKKGRDFLESERLTEVQYRAMLKTFTEHLDQIAISCSVKLFPVKDDATNFIEIRDVSCNNYITRWPKPESFPIERV